MPLSKPIKKQQLLLPSRVEFQQLPKDKKENILKHLSTDNLITYLEYIVSGTPGSGVNGVTAKATDCFTLEQIAEDEVGMDPAQSERYISDWINKSANRSVDLQADFLGQQTPSAISAPGHNTAEGGANIHIGSSNNYGYEMASPKPVANPMPSNQTLRRSNTPLNNLTNFHNYSNNGNYNYNQQNGRFDSCASPMGKGMKGPSGDQGNLQGLQASANLKHKFDYYCWSQKINQLLNNKGQPQYRNNQ